ncbi:hypothetical protein [Niabella hibiscisoli]|uniref:hypothetical protein n=1 Tax=Niabella hibiscisoli TaxID=1825928 RepID=UPI001F0E147E|nr:hypothetical protein [Niabella hibiscisoli]MCH5718876.1 hypothetical protein [Niabella hibiscisoli]
MKGVEARGFILQDGKDTVARFGTQKFGLGQFNFTPQAGKKYTAIASIPGKTSANISLPNVLSSGRTLSIKENNDTYSVTIYSTAQTQEKLYLVAHDGQANKIVKTIQPEASANTINVEKSVLSKGITYFTLFNENLQPLCERLIFTPFIPEKKSLNITSNKPIYAGRETTTLSVSGSEIAGMVDASLSVFKETGNDSQEPMWIYLSLTRHLNGTIENPEFYFTPAANQYNYIDNLMLTRGWRQFKNLPAPLSAPVTEFDGHIISARVKDNWSKAPVAARLAC